MNIGVLDYGAGNLRNVCRAIEHLECNYHLVSNSDALLNIDKLVIPGVGAFKVAMEQLIELDLVIPIKQLAEKGIPIFGICLGMQLLFEDSYEHGYTKGLGLLRGNVKIIPSMGLHGHKVKVPHIGWNEIIVDDVNCKLVGNVQEDDAVYFVHSFRIEDYNDTDLVAHCSYDGLILPAIVQNKNIIGCQFHPEKSSEVGLEIFRRFLKDKE